MRPHLLAPAALLLTLSGCTATIIPSSSLRERATVFVVDHGRTSSLVIPTSSGKLRRYAYGDWNYYALGKDDLAHGLAALLWPTQGALGKAELHGPADSTSLRRQLIGIEHVHPVEVERLRLRAFEQQMQTLYDSALHTEVDNRLYGLRFVHHPQRYTYFWNSNHAVASWLEELGCTVRGWAARASWRVGSP